MFSLSSEWSISIAALNLCPLGKRGWAGAWKTCDMSAVWGQVWFLFSSGAHWNGREQTVDISKKKVLMVPPLSTKYQLIGINTGWEVQRLSWGNNQEWKLVELWDDDVHSKKIYDCGWRLSVPRVAEKPVRVSALRRLLGEHWASGSSNTEESVVGWRKPGRGGRAFLCLEVNYALARFPVYKLLQIIYSVMGAS